MSLPPYSSDVTWSDYKIDTPTFELSPVEKPDMSPFLFHMTGKQEIISILKPEDAGEIPEFNGYLQAKVPEAQGDDRNYQAKVVCLTESPTFALDFFRYRSFRRWRNNQLYGIGFDKSSLSRIGARPCIYADEQLKNDIIVIKNRLAEITLDDPILKERLPSLINGAYPLVMPLLEETRAQGFMWEREWRYDNDAHGGLVFPYASIRIICCPESEEGEIREILGKYANQIEFIRSWREYNEVTSYLRKRKAEMYIPQKILYNSDDEFLSALEEQLSNHMKVFNKIDAFKGFIEAIENKEQSTSQALQELQDTMQSMLGQIQKLKNL